MPRLRRLADHIPPRPRVLFVGINPGLRSSAVGHHFAGYSNRFWKLLHESGLVPERLTWADDVRLPDFGYGITNLCPRPTAGIDGLRPSEFVAGRRKLRAKLRRARPRAVALVGVTNYRALFGDRPVRLGRQEEILEGARLFVLPNPSGRNATVPYAGMLAAFVELREWLDSSGDRP